MQQLGIPEVLKMSLQTSPAKGGSDLFIIGRNFDRNTSVVFREYKDDGSLAWNAEASVDKQYLHQVSSYSPHITITDALCSVT